MISILSPVVSTVGIWVSVVSMVGVMSVSIVSIGGISGGLSISRPLAIVVSMVGIWVSKVSVVGISISMVGIGKRVSIVSIESISISLGLSGSGGLGISGPLAIVVSIVAGIWVSIVSMVGIPKMSISIVTIEIASISRCFSLASNGGEHAQGNNGNGFHHFVAFKLEDLARLPC